jgi:hypothetical protein
MFRLFFGIGVAAFTLGGLSQRATDANDLLPDNIEALILGIIFTLSSIPKGWSVIARAALPVPTVLLYLTILLGKEPPLPYYAAFTVAGCYALLFTGLSSYFAEIPS